MKKRFLIALAAIAVSLGGVALAQLVGTQRIEENYWFTDDHQIQIGSLPDAAIEYDTAQTPDALVIGTPATNDCLLISRKAEINTDMSVADLGSPGVCLMSNGGDKSLKIYHDDTNGVIDTTSGYISVPDKIVDSAVNAAGGSATAIAVSGTLGIMDNSDTYLGVDVSVTNANHTGSGNVVAGVNVGGITGDAQATETGVLVGDGWDVGVNAGNGGITTSGTITSSIATSVGWSLVTGANAACNATCTNGCVMGQDTGDANKPLVDCADTTADRCICAGAN